MGRGRTELVGGELSAAITSYVWATKRSEYRHQEELRGSDKRHAISHLENVEVGITEL